MRAGWQGRVPSCLARPTYTGEMRPDEKRALRIGAFGILVPIVSGALIVILGQAFKDSLVMTWIIGGLLLAAGVFAGSIPLFSLELATFRKVMLILGYLVVSFGLFIYSILLVACSVYGDCL